MYNEMKPLRAITQIHFYYLVNLHYKYYELPSL